MLVLYEVKTMARFLCSCQHHGSDTLVFIAVSFVRVLCVCGALQNAEEI